MKDEALKLALGALESCDFVYTYGNGGYQQFDRLAVDKAISALTQLLEAQPAVQEPQRYSPDGEGGMEVDSLGAYIKLQDVTTPPAAQRQWVGLTDAEVMHTMSGDWTSQFYFARAIEAKLKEKNNG
jgi:hypothetical protein